MTTEYTAHPTPFPYEDPEYQLPPRTRPPARRPVPCDCEELDDPHGDTATRITITTWAVLIAAGFTGALIDHQHAGYWIGIAFLLCLAVSTAALTAAAALRAVKP